MKKILLLTLMCLCLNLQTVQANIPDLSVLGYKNEDPALRMATEIIASAQHNNVIETSYSTQYVVHIGDQPTKHVDRIYQTINGKVFYKALKNNLINLNYCETIHIEEHTIHVFLLDDCNGNCVTIYLQKLSD